MASLQQDYHQYNGDGIRIAVIDSGIDKSFVDKYAPDIRLGISLKVVDSGIEISENCCDELGHGTAVTSIIHSIAKQAQFFIIKVFYKTEYEIDTKQLIAALQYIKSQLSVDIIHISSGTVSPDITDLAEMRKICKELEDMNVLVVSAFDNLGALSYPSALPEAIGVDSSTTCTSIYDYRYADSDCVNIIGRGVSQNVPWLNNEHKSVVGSSFAAGYITGFIAQFMQAGIKDRMSILMELKKYAKSVYPGYNVKPTGFKNKIKKAVAFPFNKEMHSLVEFLDLTGFELVGINTIKYDKNFHKKSSDILNRPVQYDTIIQNIDSLNWDSDFDTLIIGHCQDMAEILKRNIKVELIEKCILYNKNVYCFDNDGVSEIHIKALEEKGLWLYYPQYTGENVFRNRFGKLKVIGCPLISINGTSSIQGKFHVELGLYRRFKADNYSVGFLGTEPTSPLFGADEVYPFGYKGNIETKGIDSVLAINQLLEKIEMKNPDIIIMGSQSITAPPSVGNLSCYPCCQTEMLFAGNPDAVILCINPTDDPDYIRRTIHFIEGATQGKVIALALYPLIREDAWSVFDNKFHKLDKDQLSRIIHEHEAQFSIPVVEQNEAGLDALYELIVNYFE